MGHRLVFLEMPSPLIEIVSFVFSELFFFFFNFFLIVLIVPNICVLHQGWKKLEKKNT